MKKYAIPEIKINSFSVEDIITDSAAGFTAAAQMENQLGTAGAEKTFTMNWVQE